MIRIFLLTSFTCVLALPSIQEDTTKPSIDKAVGVKKNCAQGIFNPTCFKIGVIRLIGKLDKNKELTLLPGVTLVKDRDDGKTEAVAAELARSLPSEPEERLDKFLLYLVESFLDTHSVKLRLLDDANAAEARSAVNGARKRMGGKKSNIGPIIAMAAMMKGEWRIYINDHPWSSDLHTFLTSQVRDLYCLRFRSEFLGFCDCYKLKMKLNLNPIYSLFFQNKPTWLINETHDLG